MKLNQAKIFGGGLLLKKHTISIDFNESCNLNCLGCPRNFRCANWDSFHKYWELDDAKKLVDYLIKMHKPTELHIGVLSEFSIYKYNSEILKYISDNYPELLVTVTMNSIGLTNKFFDIVPKLNKNITLNISLWASSKEEYLKLHGKDFYDKVIENITKFAELAKTNEFIPLVSTVNYSPTQLNGVKNLIKNIAYDVNIPFDYRIDDRRGTKNILTLHANVYNGKRDEEAIKDGAIELNVEDRTNKAIGYTCDMIQKELYITYNRMFPCLNVLYKSKFNIDNLEDFELKLTEFLTNENNMPECEQCMIGFACLKKGNREGL